MNKNTILCIVITCLVFANFFIYSKVITSEIPEIQYDGYVSGETANTEEKQEETDPIAALGYTYKNVNISDTKAGSLVLVNQTHPFDFENVPVSTVDEASVSVYTSKSSSYSVSNMDVLLDPVTIAACNKMFDDFYAHLGNKRSVIVTQGHRTYEAQQAMLDLKISQLGEDQTIAQKPGYSEHHTGLAMDISTYVGGIMGTFTGENEYAWVHENAYKYGFVLRYPAGKESVTGISPESWHFRYVGVPHAEYMYKNGLTLEEYVDALSMYPVESIQLALTDSETGEAYSAYSVPVTLDGTPVPVPADGSEYTLSGDNNGHIIVTVKKAAAQVIPEQPAA